MFMAVILLKRSSIKGRWICCVGEVGDFGESFEGKVVDTHTAMHLQDRS